LQRVLPNTVSTGQNLAHHALTEGIQLFVALLGAPALAYFALNVFGSASFAVNEFYAFFFIFRPYFITISNVRLWASHTLTELYGIFRLIFLNANDVAQGLRREEGVRSTNSVEILSRLRQSAGRDVAAINTRLTTGSWFSRLSSFVSGVTAGLSVIALVVANPLTTAGILAFVWTTVRVVLDPSTLGNFVFQFLPAFLERLQTMLPDGSADLPGVVGTFTDAVMRRGGGAGGAVDHEALLREVLDYMAQHFF
ncbi:MAG: hypothetical protein ACOYPR_21105, partial [Saprospiraceae bacterium]